MIFCRAKERLSQCNWPSLTRNRYSGRVRFLFSSISWLTITRVAPNNFSVIKRDAKYIICISLFVYQEAFWPPDDYIRSCVLISSPNESSFRLEIIRLKFDWNRLKAIQNKVFTPKKNKFDVWIALDIFFLDICS